MSWLTPEEYHAISENQEVLNLVRQCYFCEIDSFEDVVNQLRSPDYRDRTNPKARPPRVTNTLRYWRCITFDALIHVQLFRGVKVNYKGRFHQMYTCSFSAQYQSRGSESDAQFRYDLLETRTNARSHPISR